MEQCSFPISRNLSLERLVSNALGEIERLGYSRRSRNRYRATWSTSSRLLEAVDRSYAKGKRDYAILLLACRLGMRVGDIRTLKLDQIHWDDSTIEVTQSKTGLPLSLPLTNEVAAD